MNVGDFEDAVWAVDGIRVVIRAARVTEVDDFDWANAAPEGQRLTVYVGNRIRTRIGDHDYCVIDGRGSEPHGRTLIRNVRQSYR